MSTPSAKKGKSLATCSVKTESPTSETAYGEIVATESKTGLSKRHIAKKIRHPKCLLY